MYVYKDYRPLERLLTRLIWLVCILLVVMGVLLVVMGVVLLSTPKAVAADLPKENASSITLSTCTLNLAEIGAQRRTEAYDVEVVKNGEPKWQTFIATAYCPNACCCGKWASIAYKATASGAGATEGRTIAMDEAYPFGTRLYIEGLGERVCEDRGSAIVGNHIDLYFNTHEAACEWGMREVRAYVMED